MDFVGHNVNDPAIIRQANIALNNVSMPFNPVNIIITPPSRTPTSYRASPIKCKNTLLTFAIKEAISVSR